MIDVKEVDEQVMEDAMRYDMIAIRCNMMQYDKACQNRYNSYNIL